MRQLGCKPAKVIDRQPSMMGLVCMGRIAPKSLSRENVDPSPLMLKNDEIGDCTSAGIGNYIRAISSLGGYQTQITDQNAIEFYSESTDYNPSDPSTDRGGYEVEVLAHAMQHGYPTEGGRFYATWGSVDHGNRNAVANVMCALGATYLGVMLSQSDMNQISATDGECVLTPDNETYGNTTPGSAGGHCLLGWEYTGLGDNDEVTLITWGNAKTRATWSWLASRGMEAHGILFPQLTLSNGLYPTGTDLTAMKLQNYDLLTNR